MKKRFLLILPLLFGLFSCSNKGKEVTRDVFESKINEIIAQKVDVTQNAKIVRTADVHWNDNGYNSYAKEYETIEFNENASRWHFDNQTRDDKTEFSKARDEERFVFLDKNANNFSLYCSETDKSNKQINCRKYVLDIDESIPKRYEEVKIMLKGYPLKTYTDMYLSTIKDEHKSECETEKLYISEQEDKITFTREIKYIQKPYTSIRENKYVLTIKNNLMDNYIYEATTFSDKNVKTYESKEKVTLSDFTDQIKVRDDVEYWES